MSAADAIPLFSTLASSIRSTASALTSSLRDVWTHDPESVLVAGGVLALTGALSGWAIKSSRDASALEARAVELGSKAIESKYATSIDALSAEEQATLKSCIKHWVREAHHKARASNGQYHTRFAAEMQNVKMMTQSACGSVPPQEYAEFLGKHNLAASLGPGDRPGSWSATPTACALGVASVFA